MEIPATTFAPVIKFRFGADARDAEGASGSVTSVVVAPDMRNLVAVGVRFGLFSRPVYVAAAHITGATEREVTFDLTRAAIEKDALKPQGVTLSGGSVSQGGKRLGKLDRLSFNADTHELRHIIFDRGLSGELVASAAAVDQISANAVTLKSSNNGASSILTPFRPDDELRDDTIKAIESYNRLRVDMAGVNVTATDGVVWLRGFVSSELNRRLIGDLVSETPGIGELHNELITDPELAASISLALARDPRTAEERIGVYPMLGRVRLRGVVRTAGAREAAEQLAYATPGVSDVENDLRVDPNANVLPVMSSVTNSEDAVPGGR